MRNAGLAHAGSRAARRSRTVIDRVGADRWPSAGQTRIELRRDCEAIAVPSGQRQTLPRGNARCASCRRAAALSPSPTTFTPSSASTAQTPTRWDSLRPRPRPQKPQGPLTDEMVWNALKTRLRSRTARQRRRSGAYLLLRHYAPRAGRQIHRRSHGHDLRPAAA